MPAYEPGGAEGTSCPLTTSEATQPNMHQTRLAHQRSESTCTFVFLKSGANRRRGASIFLSQGPIEGGE
eukprot:1189170-Prorocentrum_minimum.AAC.2